MSFPVVHAVIVDYGLGNLYNVQRACEHAGMKASFTKSKSDVLSAPLVILPGVGAFGDAMKYLNDLNLVDALKTRAEQNLPLAGICLGFQLMMSESNEFGHHKGLGIFEGSVNRLEPKPREGFIAKVPQVGWNRIFYPMDCDSNHWEGSPLEGISEGTYQYFTHSYYVKPHDPSKILSTTSYGGIEFCSSILYGRIFGCQFHPERSGVSGLQIYRNLVALVEV